MEHSKGPWTWEQVRTKNGDHMRLQDAEGYTVLSIDEYGGYTNEPGPEDAALIAAAPDLLEACRAALHELEILRLAIITTIPGLTLDDCGVHETIEQLRAAITRATETGEK